MPSKDTPKYLNPDLPVNERVQDLLTRMTLDEKLSQMTYVARAIPHLGVPAYNFWSEGLHGVARNGRATVFPQAIGLAASWDRALIKKIGNAIADEGRAKFHEVMRKRGASAQYQGLTFWSPNINIFRDPRWGRGQETWGEDPYLTGELGSAFVQGLQGDHPRYLKAAACAKHYAVHSGPEKDRHGFNAVVSPRDLNDTYLPAFRKLVREAKVEAVMGAYNRTNGEACNASKLLLEEKLRGEWGFEGHVVSDCGALGDIHRHHKLTADAVESAALALKRGCDIECGQVYDHLSEALERGLITEADIDRSLARTLATRFKLGMFDPDEMVPFAKIPMSVVNSPEHQQLAYDAAVKSIVLLKNKDGILPIPETAKTMLVTGPSAASLDVLLGNYYGISDSMSTLLEGIIARLPEGIGVEYRPGCLLTYPNQNSADWVFHMAGMMDVTVCCMGTSPYMEGEEGDAILTTTNGDRTEISLPAVQVEYIKRLAQSGARIVLVLTGGSPIALGEVEDLVDAVVFVWYPGQAGGLAVADVLFGNANPGGKLPLTFPKSLSDVPPFEDYNMQGRTYRYSTAEPLYPFGFGLSYTRFAYSGLKLAQTSLSAGEALEIEFTVTNTGERAGEEVAQVYISDLESSVPVPISKLVDFQRVALDAGESRTLRFKLLPESLMLVGEDGKEYLEAGNFRLVVGGCSPSARGLALGAPQPLVAEFSVA
ncbi:MAG TPA: glycoside hydrolase family 3 C-terminal domain-containing protein [Anaerolineaceae bacterium]